MNSRLLQFFLIGSVILFLSGLAVWGQEWITGTIPSEPEITYMRTCTGVVERATYFEGSGCTTSFSSEGEIHCVVKVDVPSDAKYDSYSATMRWYAPGGELYREEKWKDLKRGKIWSLCNSIQISGTGFGGQWRVMFSVRRGPTKSLAFTIQRAITTGEEVSLPGRPQVEEPITGREQEPNDASGTANLLAFDEKVQGEVLFYSEDVYDQDWYRIELAGNEEYWLEVNAVGMTSQWLSPFSFLGVYAYQEAALVPMSLSWEAQQEVSEDRSLCDAVAPIQGPGTYYVFILAKDCEHDIYYSLQIATSKPEAAEEGES